MTTLSELLSNRKQAINVTSNDPALKVTQNGSGNALRVEDISGDTTPFVIDADGNVGIGGTNPVGQKLRLSGSFTGSTGVYGFVNQGTIASDVTGSAILNYSGLSTQAATFALNVAKHFSAAQDSIGVGSSVNVQYGFVAESGLTGASNNYGFYGNIPAGTGRYNFYAAGTAENYFAGVTTFNSSIVVSASAKNIPLTDNDMSFDMAVKNNFICTPTGSGTLAFTNITAGQSGNILFTNDASYAIAKNSYIKSDASFLSTISSTGTYYITYFSPDGTNVYVSTTGALS